MGLLTGAGDGSSVLGSFSLLSGVVGVTGAMTLSGGSATVGGALVGVDTVSGVWTLELLVRLFSQDPSLLGRQLVQGFLAFTQAHPLQEPVLLHLQQGIFQVSGLSRA